MEHNLKPCFDYLRNHFNEFFNHHLIFVWIVLKYNVACKSHGMVLENLQEEEAIVNQQMERNLKPCFDYLRNHFNEFFNYQLILFE